MFTSISQCRICESPLLTPLWDFGEHALSCRFPAEDESDPPRIPLELLRCTGECGLVQLRHNVTPDELYKHDYGYRSGLNQTMISHLKELAEDATGIKGGIGNTDSPTPKQDFVVLDIGSNDCTLLKHCQGTIGHLYNLHCIGIDPTGEQFKEYYPNNVTLVPDYFTASNYARVMDGKRANVVTSVSMFYDLPNPVAFAADVAAILHPEGIWVSEQSYCGTMMERNSFDTICHEHLEYYFLKQFKYIADRVGLRILDVSLNDCNGGSFRVKLAFPHSRHAFISQFDGGSRRVEDMLKQENALSKLDFWNFFTRCQDMKTATMKYLQEQSNGGKIIYLYGASTKGNTLLQYYGIDNKLIVAAAERNEEKFGKRTPGTNISIVSETEMRMAKPDILLVLPWHFKREFLIREKEFLDNGGTIVFPLPYLDVVTKDS